MRVRVRVGLGSAVEDLGGLRDADPAVDLPAAAGAVVELCREQMRLHAALEVVVVGLRACAHSSELRVQYGVSACGLLGACWCGVCVPVCSVSCW